MENLTFTKITNNDKKIKIMGTNNVKVLFYEWSDVNRQPIGFLNNGDCLGFCRMANINVNKISRRK